MIRKTDYQCHVVPNVAGKLTGCQIIHLATGVIAEVKVYVDYECNQRSALKVLRTRLTLHEEFGGNKIK